MAYLLPSTSFPSSYFSSSNGAGQHDVFLSFRGIDTRNNFTSHLYRSLQQKGIQTFIDNEELRRGEEISTSLVMAIKESKISIIIFSKNYASSSWCLDELVEIFKCRESLRQLVWPIFLYVDPSDIRNHRGSFGEALAQYEESSDKKKKEKLPEWKIALNKAANLSGWHLDNGDESQLTQRIVEAALSKLNRTFLHVAKYPVGIESHLHELASLINVGEKDVRFIGIHGIGGIGKTTIAKAAFNSFADEFEGSSFLADVRETSKQHSGFVQLQEVLLFDMLGDRNLKVGNIHRGINIIKERLRNKRVLLILDDVDELDQLETLAGGHDWFGSGSRIIITSRNKHLLTTHEVKRTYEVPKLNYLEAVELFSWNAFKREEPVENYHTLSRRIVHYASGLPLALVILGSFLCGRKGDQWQSAIHNLEKKPDKKLYQILKISYDALQDDGKTLFLDIACFFVGEDIDYVTQVVGRTNFCPIIGIGVLSDMSLINVELNKIRMHNLIQEMGKEIVRQESSEAGKRSRLWSPDDIFHVLSENTGTDSIEGIMLKLPEQRTLHLNAKSFKKMKRLRLLIFNNNVVFSTAIPHLPNQLRLVDLPGYQFPTLPFDSVPSQLVILNMPSSHIHHRWKLTESIGNLKVVNFSHCRFLREIPDLSTVPNLKCLRLDGCTSLVKIHESVGSLTKLGVLDLRYCSKLRIFPSKLESKSFRKLNFRCCSRLQSFPRIASEMEYLTSIDITGTAIKELPSKLKLLVGMGEYKGITFSEKRILIAGNKYKLMHLRLLDESPDNTVKFRTQLAILDHEILLDLPLLRQAIFEWDEMESGLEPLDTVLRYRPLSEVDFIMDPTDLPLLQWLDISKHRFVMLPSLMESTEDEETDSDSMVDDGMEDDATEWMEDEVVESMKIDVVMHISGNNRKLLANLPPKSIEHIELQ